VSRIFSSHSSSDNREAVALKRWLADQRPELANEIFLDIDPRTKAYRHLMDKREHAAFRSSRKRLIAAFRSSRKRLIAAFRSSRKRLIAGAAHVDAAVVGTRSIRVKLP
jgi:hypothetical protein